MDAAEAAEPAADNAAEARPLHTRTGMRTGVRMGAATWDRDLCVEQKHGVGIHLTFAVARYQMFVANRSPHLAGAAPSNMAGRTDAREAKVCIMFEPPEDAAPRIEEAAAAAAPAPPAAAAAFEAVPA